MVERARYDRIPALKKTVATTAAMIRKGRIVKLATRYTMAIKNVKKAPEEKKNQLLKKHINLL